MKSYRYFLFSVSIIAIIIFLFVCVISLNPSYLESFLTKKSNKLPSDRQSKSIYFSVDSKYSQFLSEKQYNSFLSYLSSKTGYKFYLYSTDTNEETMDALGSNLIQFALLEDVNYAAVQKKYDVNLIGHPQGVTLHNKCIV
ncbi:MAG: PhnD/SsuA/transferrin family substrate-binding protein [Actinobacteria bacterium]|nr:PhnD/SsuA/transferrin family substrate-binding protein [Actinomycetota bacterium]